MYLPGTWAVPLGFKTPKLHLGTEFWLSVSSLLPCVVDVEGISRRRLLLNRDEKKFGLLFLALSSGAGSSLMTMILTVCLSVLQAFNSVKSERSVVYVRVLALFQSDV